MGSSMGIATGTECLRRQYDLKPGRILERIFWESGGFHGILQGYNLYGKKDNRYPSHPAENYNVFLGKKYTVFPTNPTNNENVGTRLLSYYDKDALSAEVDVQDPDPQIRKANSNFSLRDKPC